MVDLLSTLVSASLQVLFDRLASSQFLNLFRRKTFGRLDLMKILLLSMNAVIGDAEEKQIVDPYVKIWVDELREVVYDAQDLMDQIDTGVLQYKVESKSHTTIDQVKEYINSINPFTKNLNDKLDEIIQRLDALSDHKNDLGLKVVSPEKLSTPFLNLPTTRMVDEFEVYGRYDDKEKLLPLLLSSYSAEDGPSYTAIVGMAGVGKTTLAQIVFKEFQKRGNFDIASWVYVSEGSDVFHLTTKVYESVAGLSSGVRSLDMLQLQLNERVRRKRVFIVLDDFWAENFLDWNLFKMAFRDADRGSVVLVTTRNENVAITMNADIYPLSYLPYVDCWSIFARHAFKYTDPDAYPTLREIGEKIVRKCKGLPLAAKVFGSLLSSVKEVEQWDNILQSKMWDLPNDKSNMLPIFRLSYQLLPPHLKPCFAYCSIFLRVCLRV